MDADRLTTDHLITHRIGLEDTPAMYRTFRDKQNAYIKVVMKPVVATPHHTDPPSSRQQ
jgi:threonine dehydrogenase-like Zn-dependent dehydrogenase